MSITLSDLEGTRHWKVGDGMKTPEPKPEDDPNGFIIHQMALVESGKDTFILCYYDPQGRLRGTQRLRLDKTKAKKPCPKKPSLSKR